jgi:hypothetical protein
MSAAPEVSGLGITTWPAASSDSRSAQEVSSIGAPALRISPVVMSLVEK